MRIASGPVDPVRRRHAVAAYRGTYAAVHPVVAGDARELALVLCSNVHCPDPATYPLGRVTGDDMVDVDFGADATVWVVRSDGPVVRLSAVTPGATTVTDVLELGDPTHSGASSRDDAYRPVLDLTVLPDGRPVVLHREIGTTDLHLVTCDGVRCAHPTTVTLPGGPHRDAELLDDGTGRPLVVASGDALTAHSCDDRRCTRMSSAWLSGSTPARYPWQRELTSFTALDDHGRPIVHVGDTQHPVLVRCEQPRCGLR